MAKLSVSLANLLKNINYQYALASKQNASNIESSVNSSNAEAKTSRSAIISTKSSNISVSTSTSSKIANVSSSLSNLKKILSNISKKTSVLNNTSVITNDMVTEFFKSYKNATMTAIYNKLQNGTALTETDLANFKSQVAKLSTDEQKLWKTEISNIQAKIEANITKNVSNTNNSSNTGSNSNSNSKSNTPVVKTTVLNGFVSGVLYSNGEKFTGTYTDGKYYVNGVLANTTVDGKLYQNGVLANATVNGKLYQNGVLANGTINGKTYQNGVEVTSTTNTSSAVVSKTTDSNGNILGYDSKGNLVYLEKEVNGKKVVYTDELQYLNAKTLKYLKSVDEAVLNDRLLSDIKIVQNAEAAALKAGAKGTAAYEEAYNASIKSQMIKTTSNAQNVAGEVVEKNGSLYVNDGSKLVKLNISAETYLELFPPVDRYDVNQNSIGDCYFVSGCLTDLMKNGEAYAELLQLFSEDSSGNITVKFAGSLSSYPVTFQNGQLKVMDGYVDGNKVTKYTNASGSLGAQMLEQAYSIARFAKESKTSVDGVDLDETISTIKGGWQYNVYNEVLGMKSERSAIDANSAASYLNSMASKVNSGGVILSFASYGTVSEYNLTSKHAYSIESIDTKNQVVYVTNPWFSGGSIAVPYDVFTKTAWSDNNKIYFNVGYVNA